MVSRQPRVELPGAAAVRLEVFKERRKIFRPKPEPAPLLFRPGILRHLFADRPLAPRRIDDPPRPYLDPLAVDGCLHAMRRTAGADFDLVGKSVQHPRPERAGPLAACQIEFLTAQLAGLVKQDLRRVHRVGAIGRIGQIQFVVKGQPVLQHLRSVEVGA
jgi:hypothetical protein